MALELNGGFEGQNGGGHPYIEGLIATGDLVGLKCEKRTVMGLINKANLEGSQVNTDLRKILQLLNQGIRECELNKSSVEIAKTLLN